MRFKKQLVSTLVIGAMLAGVTVNAKSLAIAIKESQVKWQGSKGIKALGVHTGSVQIQDAEVEIDKKGIIRAAEMEIDLSKITNDDLSGEWRDKLIGHLKSKDFFDVENHKIAKFKSKSVTKINDNQYKFKGDLTIKGITKAIIFVGDYSKHAGQHKLTGEFKFNRLDYDIKYNSAKFFSGLGDKLIHDEVVIKFDLQTV